MHEIEGIIARTEQNPDVHLEFPRISYVFHKGAGVVATPHGFLPRDSHEISPTIGGGTQVDDFNKGISKGFFDKILRRRNGGGQGDPDPLVKFETFRNFLEIPRKFIESSRTEL